MRLYFLECPVTDVIGAIIGDVGVDAGTAAAVGDAALDAGIAGTAADAVGAGVADATLAGLGDAAIAGTSAGLDAATVSGLAGAGGALSGVGTTAALGAGADSAGGALGTLLPEQTVTATSLAPSAAAVPAAGAGGTTSALGNLAGNVGQSLGIAGLAAGAGAGGGGSGVPGTLGQPADFSGATASNASPGTTDTGSTLSNGTFLSATGASDIGELTPSLSQSLGIDPSLADPTQLSVMDNPGIANVPGIGGGGDSGFLNDVGSDLGSGAGDIGKWLENPKNLGTAGLLGLSLKNALTTPKLPGASQTAANSATQAVQGAQSVIASGGTATPEWASQKAAIDASIDQQIQQQSEALMQAAASSGQGGKNSGIVQQQIQTMTANLNVQRQQLYQQAQQQNVNAALSELSGGDQVLTSIGGMQLQQSEQAQQLAAQTAELALLLQSGGQVKIPGATVGSP